MVISGLDRKEVFLNEINIYWFWNKIFGKNEARNDPISVYSLWQVCGF